MCRKQLCSALPRRAESQGRHTKSTSKAQTKVATTRAKLALQRQILGIHLSQKLQGLLQCVFASHEGRRTQRHALHGDSPTCCSCENIQFFVSRDQAAQKEARAGVPSTRICHCQVDVSRGMSVSPTRCTNTPPPTPLHCLGADSTLTLVFCFCWHIIRFNK